MSNAFLRVVIYKSVLVAWFVLGKLPQCSIRTLMAILRLRCLRLEMYKTINRPNPAFMTDIFKLSDSKKLARKQNVLNLNVTRPNQVRFGERSLRVLGPKIWNNLPAHVKSASNLLSFKRFIKSCDGISCKRNLCKKL